MSLEAAYDAGNVFARIVRGELPAVKVYEDETALAFMDLFPQSRGHTLVIPKSTTATNLLTEDSDALQALIVRVQRVRVQRRGGWPDHFPPAFSYHPGL
jgi:histidine triad (HIT) family protein